MVSRIVFKICSTQNKLFCPAMIISGCRHNTLRKLHWDNNFQMLYSAL